jgi:hypothetical protein
MSSELKGDELISQERKRQIDVEGWSRKHDSRYINDELIEAALTYTETYSVNSPTPSYWPWDERWFKPTTRIRNLVKAGALIAAEIDRLLYEEVCNERDSSAS